MREASIRLRLSLVDGPSLQCPRCSEWWPITTDFWRVNRWDRCLACRREQDRLRAALKRRDAAYRADQADKQRRYRAWLRKEAPEVLAIYERERRAEKRERLRAYRARQREAAHG